MRDERLPASTVDDDLHGLARIRLFAAAPVDTAAVSRELAHSQRPLDREPNIIVLADQLSAPAHRYLCSVRPLRRWSRARGLQHRVRPVAEARR